MYSFVEINKKILYLSAVLTSINCRKADEKNREMVDDLQIFMPDST